VLLGDAPATDEFRAQFDWPDAVIHMPFDCPGIEAVLAELVADPQRLALISRNNARNAALRHDWLHRLEVIFNTLGMPPTAGMLERKQRLAELAQLIP
jgi:hypothetical protein